MQHCPEEKKNHGTDLFPFECYSSQFDENWYPVPYHWHEQTEIIYVEKGEIILTVDGSTNLRRQGDIVFINPGQFHQLVIDNKDTRYFSFVFSMDWLDFKNMDYIQDSILNQLKNDMDFPPCVSPGTPRYQNLKRELLSIRQVYRMQPDNYSLMIKILLYKVLLLLSVNHMFVPASSRQSMNHSQSVIRVKALIDFVAAHYQERITLEQGARIMHMSPKYFSSFFTRTFLINFTQYINQYRINQACILLKTTDLPIMDVAFESGFENFSYFIKRFKEIRGCTPKEYRKRMSPIMAEE